MSISVIIPTRNRIESLVRCLRSIAIQSRLPDELIIVDSSDCPLVDHHEYLQMSDLCRQRGMSVVYQHSAPGLTYQRNIGIRLVSGSIIYFFDDDVVLHHDYIELMQRVFEKNSLYHAGMGTMTHPSVKFSINRLLRVLFLMQRENASGKFTYSGMPTHAYGRRELQEVESLGGCCMAFRADIFKEFLFDERLRFYSYMEDCDFSFRISRKYKLFYNPAAVLEHLHSPLARDRAVDNRAMYINNYSYLFFKNFYPTAKLKIFAYFWTTLGLFIEALLARNGDYLRGYVRGLKNYWLRRSFPENGL